MLLFFLFFLFFFMLWSFQFEFPKGVLLVGCISVKPLWGVVCVWDFFGSIV